MDTKPVFHGSDIEKICSYYNLKKENIVKFGANVNPLGLSPKAGRAIAEHVDILSSLPGQRIHIPSEYDFQLLQYSR